MNIVREIVDPSPIESVATAEREHIDAHNAASAAVLALTLAEREVLSAERELAALLKRTGFDRSRKEMIDAATAKVAAVRKARDAAKETLDKAKALAAWRADQAKKARRAAFEPAKADAIKRLIEIAESADEKRAELAAIGDEFDAAVADLQAAVSAGAHCPHGVILKFSTIKSVDELRVALQNIFGQVVA